MSERPASDIRDLSNAQGVIARLQKIFSVSTDVALASKLGVPNSTVGSWRARGTIPYAECVEIANERGISLDWLLSGVGLMLRDAPADRALAERPDDFGTGSMVSGLSGAELGEWHGVIPVKIGARTFYVNPRDYCFLPYYDIALAAGGGAEVLDEEPKAFNAYRRESLLSQGLDPDQLSVFCVRGESMTPDINDRDTVLVDRRVTVISVEDVYVIRMDNALVVKYARLQPDRSILITSANPSYAPMTVRPDEFPDVRFEVIGRVAHQGRYRWARF